MALKSFVVLDGARMRVAGTGDTLGMGVIQMLGAQQAAIADPSGGLIQDAVARDAIVAILAALRAHGLIASS